jgi:aryl-alcohol dehydrogenase-like predicted oxidoreductase
MIYRQVGTTNIEASLIGFGCSRLGSVGASLTPKDAGRLIQAACEMGINFFDTANIYGQGQSEEILGRTLARKRDRMVILTKAGYQLPRGGSTLVTALKPLARRLIKGVRRSSGVIARARASSMRQDFRPESLVRSLEGSLKRLRTDYIDVFFLHSLPADELGNNELFACLEGLKESGKVRHYGISMTSFPSGIAARLPDGVRIVGSAINAGERSNLSELEALSRSGVAVIGYRPFLSGSIFAEQGVETLSQETRARAALRFAFEQPGVSHVVLGTSNIRHLKENVETAEAGVI